ncbi:KPN_02809 family neutral zinc metallopeptidase [Zunongwangia sp. HGR-M22]|uniref:KPN_02809 family neutral zinc metallopeptidase n=1 Tax=Zunongwangia sp. HGR-M22 TaxID=3015168 RepID=UPI0022DD14E6|nr:neutral zinc metallopeptidase [Zunongwangia sp. HGR-M22]WBL26895.1 zinc metallopeptidase [Zunongwangia sp. HGR-M22]
MKWKDRRQSSNVDDRRGMSTKGKTIAGGGIVAVIVIALQLFTGVDLSQIISEEPSSVATEKARELSETEIEEGEFAATILADTEDIWTSIFSKNEMTYPKPGMVLFDDAVNSGCGRASAAMGPFYCPADQKLYLDLRFFDELHNKFGAEKGDFATAYVIAHEVGHHIQTVLGTSQKVRQLQQSKPQDQANELSVALELQADFYAGVWANHNQEYLQEGDIQEALSAANAVGDDAIQRRINGTVNPDSFTHGTSAQRMEWFMKGYRSGDISKGNTFQALLN